MLKLGIKKPKQERSKGTVEAILEAVTQIMDKDGPMALTTNKIAEKAGVSVGSLYQYFKNKESIFEAILLRMTEENLESLEKNLSQRPQSVGIREIIRLVVMSHFDNIQKMGRLTSVLFEYAPQVLSPNHFKKADERIVRFLLDKVDEYKLELKPKNKGHAFFICSQAVRSVIFMSYVQRPPEEHPLIMEELIDMLTSYLEVPNR
jgi:AcrR family transcriptional regulator